MSVCLAKGKFNRKTIRSPGTMAKSESITSRRIMRRAFIAWRCFGPSLFALVFVGGITAGWALCNVAWIILLVRREAHTMLAMPTIIAMSASPTAIAILILSLLVIQQRNIR